MRPEEKSIMERIIKNSVYGSGFFPSERSDRMKNPPIERMVVDTDIAHMYPQIIDYAKLDCEVTKKLHDIIDREIERRKNMNFLKTINWSVGRIEVEKKSPYLPAVIKAELNGVTAGDPNPSDILDHLMGIMNDSHMRHRITPKPQPTIKDVIFNPPATIVFWSDNTKTVVKCQEGDSYDPEKGLAMAIVKKTYGNQGNYCEKLKPWLKKCEDKRQSETSERFTIGDWARSISETVDILKNKLEPYNPVTKHYGYITIRDAKLGDVWKVCHEDEAHILIADLTQEWSHSYLSRAGAVVICHRLEKAHYGE